MTLSGDLRWLCVWLLVLTPAAFAAEQLTGTEQALWEWLAGVPFAPLIYLLTYILAQQVFISSVAFCVVGGALFGPVYGTLLSLTGATLGAALSFLMSRHLLASRITPRLSPTMRKIRDEVEREGWKAVMFIRLLPILPFTPLNYTLGLTRLTLLQFLLPTFLCIAPRVAVYAYLGHAGRQAMQGSLGVIWDVLIAVGLLVVITWLPHVLRKRSAK